MRIITSTVLLAMGLGLSACASTGGEEGKSLKAVEREAMPDSRFAPASLEEAIELLIDGIETSSASDELAMGVVLKQLTGFWRPVVVGANRALGELEVVGSVQGPSVDDGDSETIDNQIAFVDDNFELGVDGLIIAPETTELIEPMDAFSNDGKPVITIDSDLPDSKRDLFIGTDNVRAGVTGGETLVEALDGKTGHVIVLGTTSEGWVGGYSRTNAAVEVLEKAGNEVTVLSSIWNADEELDQVVATLEGMDVPIVGMLGVFANAPVLATGALEVIPDDMPTIVAFDFEPSTLSYMEDGVIAATHVQRQYYMGYMSVYIMYSIYAVGIEETKAALGDHLIDGFHVDTGLDVIRSEDLDEYNAFVDELGI